MVWTILFYYWDFPYKSKWAQSPNKDFIPVGPIQEQVFAETNASLYQTSWHWNTLLQSLAIHHFRMRVLEQHALKTHDNRLSSHKISQISLWAASSKWNKQCQVSGPVRTDPRTPSLARTRSSERAANPALMENKSPVPSALLPGHLLAPEENVPSPCSAPFAAAVSDAFTLWEWGTIESD